MLLLALLALSFNLLFGMTGLLSFGQGAFYAGGAYTAALLLRAGAPLLWSIPGSARSRPPSWLRCWRVLRPEHAHLLLHADARLRHAGLRGGVEVDVRDRRRRRPDRHPRGRIGLPRPST